MAAAPDYPGCLSFNLEWSAPDECETSPPTSSSARGRNDESGRGRRQAPRGRVSAPALPLVGPRGFWKKAFRFPSDCQNCLQVGLENTGDSLKIETLRLDEPNDPPIEGDPQELLEKWQGHLGFRFDEKMKLVPP